MTNPGGILAEAELAASTIEGRAEEIEAARRLPADIAHGLAGRGLFAMLVPARIGGLELPPAEALAAMERIAMADGAAGWCTMIASTSALAAAYLPEDEARAIYGPPGTITGGVFAPLGTAVPQGAEYQVSGRWQWASGSINCHWLMGGCRVVRDGEVERLPNGAPASRLMMFPADKAVLHDTWYAVGMSGTGSGDMEVEGITVPYRRSFSFMTDRPTADGALYRFPVFGLLALGIAAVALGNARGAIESLKGFAAEKRRQGSTRTIAQTGQGQTKMAEAEAAWRGARAYVFDAVGRAWDEAQNRPAMSLETRADLRLAAINATRVSADVARIMYDLGGGASVFLTMPLQRRFRDAHVATQHMMVAPSTYELAGRVLFGQEVDPTFL